MAKRKPQLDQSETIDSLPLACASEDAARLFIERERWGDTPCCPHCGDVKVYKMTGAAAEKRGLWRCHGCKKQFTVRVGSIFEDSKFPLTMWCKAMWEATSCKNGVSALELARKLQITHKSALFLMHRIRHAMAHSPFSPPPLLSGEVEMDETYVGGKPRRRGRALRAKTKTTGRGTAKQPVVAVVQRGGDVRTEVVPSVHAANLGAVMEKYIEKGSRIITDDFPPYRGLARKHGTHRFVRHSYGQYVSPVDRTVHTNTIEGFFSRVKRTLTGTYHAVSVEHLHRYLDQCAFSYNTRELNDGERLCTLIRQVGGKRLLYRQPKGKPAA